MLSSGRKVRIIRKSPRKLCSKMTALVCIYILTGGSGLTESPHIQQEFKEDNQSIRDNQDNDKEMKVCTVQHNLHTTTPSVRVCGGKRREGGEE